MALFHKPEEVLFMLLPGIEQMVTSASLHAVSCGLAVLSTMLRAIPRYAIDMPEEYSWLERENRQEDSERSKATTKRMHGGESFATRRYEGLFNLVKSIITVMSVCPSADHRNLARLVLQVRLLPACRTDLRIQLIVSTIRHCPFSAVCSLLLQLWKGCVVELIEESSFVSGWTSARAMWSLLIAAKGWVKRAIMVEKDFTGPAVTLINSIRVILSLQLRIMETQPAAVQWALTAETESRRLFAVDKEHLEKCRKGGCQQCCTSDSSVFLAQLMADVVEPLQKLTVGETSSNAGPRLTPVEVFSIESAVSGITSLLALTE
jgi:hypothetical protein